MRASLSLMAVMALFTSSCCRTASPAQSTVAGAPGPAAGPASSQRHVIVVSVDGLLPQSYMAPDDHGLAVPTLRMLKDAGAFSPGVRSVFPSVTYPAHTSMVTGVRPAVHGITSNRTWDPLGENQDGWYWYAEDIRVPPIWQIATAAGLRTALINWPVTVGAEVDYLVAEYWRAGTGDDVKLIKALSTPGLLEATAARFDDFWQTFTPPDTLDKASIDVAIHILETAPPELMFVHTWMVDEYQHRNGPWSDEARARIEEADTQIGRLIDAARRAGIWDRTTLVVVSDHGFLPVEQVIRPGVMLADMGLVTLDDQGGVTDWLATLRADGGAAFLYVKDDDDQVTRDALVEAFGDLAKQPDSGIHQVLMGDEIRARGGDPRAFMALDAAAGFSFAPGFTGEVRTSTPGKGTHGYDPLRPELHASLLIHGPGIAPGPIEGARLIDLAPTIASWLGLSMPEARGRVLDVTGR